MVFLKVSLLEHSMLALFSLLFVILSKGRGKNKKVEFLILLTPCLKMFPTKPIFGF